MLCSSKVAGWAMACGSMLAAPLLAAAPAAAQYAASPYRTAPPLAAPAPDINLTQRGIPAEATAENGVLARERALAAGRRTAWERALSEAGLPPTTLSDDRIEDLVASIVIEQERILPTRYTGRITVVFNPNRVRQALGRGGAPGGRRRRSPPRRPRIGWMPSPFIVPWVNGSKSAAACRRPARWLRWTSPGSR